MDHLTITDAIGFICFGFMMFGQWQITKKVRSGWVFRMVGDSGWFILGLLLGMWSIVCFMAIALVIDAKGYLHHKPCCTDDTPTSTQDPKPRW